MPTLEEIYEGVAPDWSAATGRHSKPELSPFEVPPTMPPSAPKPAEAVEELDLLRYIALHERFQRQHYELELAKVRLASLQGQQLATGDELGALLDTLGSKYNVDFHTHRIQPDGSIIPLK